MVNMLLLHTSKTTVSPSLQLKHQKSTRKISNKRRIYTPWTRDDGCGNTTLCLLLQDKWHIEETIGIMTDILDKRMKMKDGNMFYNALHLLSDRNGIWRQRNYQNHIKKITHPDVVRAIISRFGALVGYHSLTLWYRTSFLKIISDRQTNITID